MVDIERMRTNLTAALTDAQRMEAKAHDLARGLQAHAYWTGHVHAYELMLGWLAKQAEPNLPKEAN